MIFRFLLSIICMASLCSCTHSVQDHNQLSKEELAGDWHLLFDGRDPGQWRSYLKDSLEGWVVEDGALKALGLGADLGGDIITRKQYENFELKLTKKDTFAKWDIVLKRIELVGSLDELQGKLDELIDGDNTSVFTDLHTHEMEIRLGEPVHMPRKDCDSDPNQGCSYGLHVGSTSYVEGFANSESVVLVCLVNPMHVVAVPENNSSKIRVSQYFPFALATFEDRKIDIIQQPYFEYDYIAHEEEELKELLAANMDEERKICYNAPADDRSNDEYLTILEARVTNLAIAFEK